MRRRATTAWLTAALLAASGAAVPAQAQDTGLEDGRWLPYLGCWVDADAAGSAMTCVVPEGGGVALLTVAGGEVTERRVLDAGAPRPTETAGCTGTEAVSFSSDGDRVYTHTRLMCGESERQARGVIAMVDARRWVEVRAIASGAGSAAWVKRYRPAPAERVEGAGLADRLDLHTSPVTVSARLSAAGLVGIDDVIEAHEQTDPEAVRVWLVEQGDPLRIDADALVRLADAGVDPEVIDVAVAVSFPDRFQVGPDDRDRQTFAYDGYGYGFGTRGLPLWGPYSALRYDRFLYGYDPYFGYGGLYGGWVNYRPTVYVVDPGEPSNGPRGRAIKGRGYTRGSGDTATRPSVIRSLSPAGSGSGAAVRSGGSSSSSGSKGKAKPRGGK